MNAVVFIVDFEEFQTFLSRQVTVAVFDFPRLQLVVNLEHLGKKVNERFRPDLLIGNLATVDRINVRMVDDDKETIYWLQQAAKVISWKFRIKVFQFVLSFVLVAAKHTEVEREFV